MATAQQLKALLQSYSDANSEMFVSIAMQIAAHEARMGKRRIAAEIKELVDEIKSNLHKEKIGGSVPIARPTGDLATLLSVSYPKTKFSEMVLSEEIRNRLSQVLHEYRKRSKLREFGLSARRKLLFAGPPGVGKTMTARALAGELRLPLFNVQLHSLITKFMGETAAKLHAIFQSMVATTGVYLFDEFDAIGAMRSGRNDVGEIRRVLNSFLQFLEQDESESLIIAATNLTELLDLALYRRFDDVLLYSQPSISDLQLLIENRLAAFKFEGAKQIAKIAEGLSHAELCRACDEAAKLAILSDRRYIKDRELVAAIQNQQLSKKRMN